LWYRLKRQRVVSFEAPIDKLAFLQTITHYVTVVYVKLRTQAAVQESKERFRFILDSIPQKIATAKPDGSVDYFNPQWMEYTGLNFEQIKDFGWKQFIHPNDIDEHFRGWINAVKTGEVYEHESRFRRADGEYRWHISRGVPMRDESGKIIIWIGANTDIHDIKLAEMALMDSESRYRRLFETAKDGILLLDTESGRITDANPFMSELLGYSHQHFLGKELWEIGLFSDKSANEAAVRTLQTSGYIRYEHLPLETNIGQKVEVEIVANAYHEDDHKVIQCNIRDITERSRMEIQMREQAVTLEDLHRRKDEFLAMLSHELRNPLSPIASALQLLSLQKNEDQLQQKARTIIERQVGQLTRLIDDLLEVSRITTGRIHLQQEPVALNGIVEHAIETVRPLIVRHQHALTVSLSKEPIWLFADAARLEQVVVNLLTNAAKYTHDSGQIWLTVQQDGDECELRVRDNGVGIAPETLPHVFDLFTQAERSLDRSQGGLGIGLALVQRIVEMHKGRVEAFSTLGQGTEFVVHLPVMTPSANQTTVLENENIQKNEHSLRVMVVDDNEDAAQMLGMLLLSSGHEVLTVHDGPSTLTAAQDFLPDVVLLDIGLPGMDGFEVAKKMREQVTFKDVVLIAMTGYGQVSDRQRSKEAGFDHHLVKPPDFKKLQQILEAVSEKKN
jgi:PAS domain S-box-containing protein